MNTEESNVFLLVLSYLLVRTLVRKYSSASASRALLRRPHGGNCPWTISSGVVLPHILFATNHKRLAACTAYFVGALIAMFTQSEQRSPA